MVTQCVELQPNLYITPTLKTDLLSLIKENVCSHLYVDAKVDNILFPNPSKMEYLESHKNIKKPANFTKLIFSFSQLSLCNSVSSS